jgi:hypothetical protein
MAKFLPARNPSHQSSASDKDRKQKIEDGELFFFPGQFAGLDQFAHVGGTSGPGEELFLTIKIQKAQLIVLLERSR